MRALLCAAALFAGLFTSSAAAHAEQLLGETGSNCGSHVADVRVWRPEYGPPAAFIADAYLSPEGSLFVGLGFDKTGFWSAEDEPGTDACDDCGQLNLVHTTFRGVRKTHVVYSSKDAPETDLEAPATAGDETQRIARSQSKKRELIKKRLFSLAAGPWKIKSLSHDYRLSTPRRDEDGKIERFTGWFAEASQTGEPTLRFGIVSRPFMCWCDDSWQGYALASPKKK